MASLTELIGELAKVDGVNAVVVVGRDGFVIESSGAVRVDQDAIGAVISSGIGSSEVMGRELKIGELSQTMFEYGQGLIVATLLGRDAILAIVGNDSCNIGNVRYQIKKRSDEITRAI